MSRMKQVVSLTIKAMPWLKIKFEIEYNNCYWVLFGNRSIN